MSDNQAVTTSIKDNRFASEIGGFFTNNSDNFHHNQDVIFTDSVNIQIDSGNLHENAPIQARFPVIASQLGNGIQAFQTYKINSANIFLYPRSTSTTPDIFFVAIAPYSRNLTKSDEEAINVRAQNLPGGTIKMFFKKGGSGADSDQTPMGRSLPYIIQSQPNVRNRHIRK